MVCRHSTQLDQPFNEEGYGILHTAGPDLSLLLLRS